VNSIRLFRYSRKHAALTSDVSPAAHSPPAPNSSPVNTSSGSLHATTPHETVPSPSRTHCVELSMQTEDRLLVPTSNTACAAKDCTRYGAQHHPLRLSRRTRGVDHVRQLAGMLPQRPAIQIAYRLLRNLTPVPHPVRSPGAGLRHVSLNRSAARQHLRAASTCTPAARPDSSDPAAHTLRPLQDPNNPHHLRLRSTQIPIADPVHSLVPQISRQLIRSSFSWHRSAATPSYTTAIASGYAPLLLDSSRTAFLRIVRPRCVEQLQHCLRSASCRIDNIKNRRLRRALQRLHHRLYPVAGSSSPGVDQCVGPSVPSVGPSPSRHRHGDRIVRPLLALSSWIPDSLSCLALL